MPLQEVGELVLGVGEAMAEAQPGRCGTRGAAAPRANQPAPALRYANTGESTAAGAARSAHRLPKGKRRRSVKTTAPSAPLARRTRLIAGAESDGTGFPRRKNTASK
ncbi:hypothetical protein AOLI_G00131050 [Acnodon oligacanthus]